MTSVAPDLSAYGAVTQQPGVGSNVSDGLWSTAGVTVRELCDTSEDAAFASRMIVEAVRPQMTHAVGKRNLPNFIKSMAGYYRGQEPRFYTKAFVAELEGKRAGLAQLKFHGQQDREEIDGLCEMGCCAVCGLICLELAMNEKVSQGRCLLDCIAVEEEFRGKGIGKVLIGRAEQEARTRQCSSIYLACVSSNRAKDLYERQGFVVTSEETCCGCLRCTAGVKSYYYMEKPLK